MGKQCALRGRGEVEAGWQGGDSSVGETGAVMVAVAAGDIVALRG